MAERRQGSPKILDFILDPSGPKEVWFPTPEGSVRYMLAELVAPMTSAVTITRRGKKEPVTRVTEKGGKLLNELYHDWDIITLALADVDGRHSFISGLDFRNVRWDEDTQQRVLALRWQRVGEYYEALAGEQEGLDAEYQSVLSEKAAEYRVLQGAALSDREPLTDEDKQALIAQAVLVNLHNPATLVRRALGKAA